MKYWRYIVRFGLKQLFTAGEDKKRNSYISHAVKAMTERAERAERDEKDGDVREPMRKDYFYFLNRSTDAETHDKYTIPEIQAECTLLMNAGSNGPSVVLDATFFYLTRYPAVYARLAHEIRSTFNSVDEIVSGEKMNTCTYLRAVLDEALRCCPPIFGVLPRQVLPGGETIDGVYLPEDTILGVSAYCIHHDPKYFPKPFEFKPERWIAEDDSVIGPDDVQAARSAFFAFSLGGSGCVGKGVAYQEMSIALARVLYRFDFRLKAGDETGAGKPTLGRGRRNPLEFQVRDVFAVLTTGPMVEFRRREGLS
jgi:cytochrome P450